MKKISFLTTILLFSISGADASQFGCGAAVEYYKYWIMTCNEDGMPYCKDMDMRDFIWSEALKDQHIIDEGGCEMQHRPYDLDNI